MTAAFDDLPAADRRAIQIRTLQKNFLQTLLAADGETATVCEATARERREAPYPDRGAWVGFAVRDLAGLIRPALDANKERLARQSYRPTRKGSLVGLWQIADREAARKKAEALSAWLERQPEKPKQKNLFD